MVNKAISNAQAEVERQYDLLSDSIQYRQEVNYDPRSVTVTITDVYTIPLEIVEKCYDKPISEIILRRELL